LRDPLAEAPEFLLYAANQSNRHGHDAPYQERE
jgi:hypothetical protein